MGNWHHSRKRHQRNEEVARKNTADQARTKENHENWLKNDKPRRIKLARKFTRGMVVETVFGETVTVRHIDNDGNVHVTQKGRPMFLNPEMLVLPQEAGSQ